MKCRTLAFIPVLLLCFPTSLRADFFGGDLPLLAQLIVNSIQQIMQLKSIVSSGEDTLDLMKDINKGIGDSLRVLRTINPNIDPGIYRDWQNVDDAMRKLQAVYGIIVPSKDAAVQRDSDAVVSEAVTLNNQIYGYTHDIDVIGEEIKDFSHEVSPGGAQKLTAQTLGIMLHVMNQSLRTQGEGLKLQAQMLAVQNKHEKDETAHKLATSNELEVAMKTERVTFSVPRFR